MIEYLKMPKFSKVKHRNMPKFSMFEFNLLSLVSLLGQNVEALGKSLIAFIS